MYREFISLKVFIQNQIDQLGFLHSDMYEGKSKNTCYNLVSLY